MSHPDETLAGAPSAGAIAMVCAVVHEKLSDAFTPGYWAEFAPDEADLAGAFEETALNQQDAAESDVDLLTPD